MKQTLGDFARGLLYGLPILAAAALGAREILLLRAENARLEAAMQTEVRARLAAEEKIAGAQRQLDSALAARFQATQDITSAQGATEERLNQVIDFLKKEVQSAEAAIQALRGQASGPSPTPDAASAPARQAETTGLLSEISRLNAEIEALRQHQPIPASGTPPLPHPIQPGGPQRPPQ